MPLPFRPLCAAVLTLPALLWSQTNTSCEEPAAVHTALHEARQALNGKDEVRPSAEMRRQRQERLKAIAAQYPDDLWAQRAYLDSMKEWFVAPDELVSSLKQRWEAHPDDPAATYLYAYALLGKNTPQTIALLTPLTQKVPAFPLPWLSLAAVYGYPAFQDRQKAKTYAEGFLARCPESLHAVSVVSRLESSAILVTYARTLRQRIAGKADEHTLNLYAPLWTLEFKVTPLSEHPQLRQQVAEDLRFLSSLDRTAFPMLSYVLPQGYQLTGNKEALAKLGNAAQKPGELMPVFMRAQEEERKANPFPGTGDSAKVQDHYRRHLAFLDEWAQKLPDQEFVQLDRLRTLAAITGTPDATLVAEGDKVVNTVRQKKSPVGFPSPALLQVAEAWAQRGLALDRVPALVQEGLTMQRAKRSGGLERSDLFASRDQQEMDENNRWYADTTAWHTLAAVYSKMGQSAELTAVLKEWGAGLAVRRKRAAAIQKKREEEKPAPDAAGKSNSPAEEALVRSLPYEEMRYNEAQADFAAKEKRSLDALAFYQAALRTLPYPLPQPESHPDGRKAAEVWKQAGGSPEGWQAWLASLKGSSPVARVSPPDRWQAQNRPLPAFSLADQRGQTWTLANIQGKTTLLNIWATWCGPCKQELPHLQKMYDRVKDREDIQIVTLNVDENTGLIEPFLKENKFTFPVIPAKPYLDAFSGTLPIPTNWIADRTATLRWASVGFGGEGETFMKQTLDQLEKIRAAPSAK